MNFLTNIIEYKKKELEKQKLESRKTLDELRNICLSMDSAISFIKKIKYCAENNDIALISEVKKASPSKGLIRPDFKPVEIAVAYEQAGASAISVLTDEKFFQGSIEYLKTIKKAVSLPVLRKDFIIDPFQIYQTRLMGADMMLLIASALKFSDLKEYYNLAKEIGLEVLIEIHNKQELNDVLALDAKLIGINNRNLKTFEVDIKNTVNLIDGLNLSDRFIISESGIRSNNDIKYLKQNNVSGVLVGETLIRNPDIKKAVKELIYG